MTIKVRIQYHELNGKIILGDYAPDDIQIHEVDVDFDAYPRWENDGIGSYEYNGSREYDKGNNYVSLEFYGEPTYYPNNYNKKQNEAIKLYMESPEFENLCQRFCDEFEDNSKEF